MTGLPLPAPDRVTVSVLNGTGVSNQAGDTGGALTALGFHVVGVGDSTPVGAEAETVVYFAKKTAADQAAAQAVAKSLSGAVVTALGPTTDGADVTVVTGTQFTVDSPAAPATAAAAGATRHHGRSGPVGALGVGCVDECRLPGPHGRGDAAAGLGPPGLPLLTTSPSGPGRSRPVRRGSRPPRARVISTPASPTDLTGEDDPAGVGPDEMARCGRDLPPAPPVALPVTPRRTLHAPRQPVRAPRQVRCIQDHVRRPQVIRPRGGTTRRGGDGQVEPSAPSAESVGTQLQRARAERGLDLLTVHDRLGRPITQIEALEHDDLEALPDEALALSTLRRYATLLGLDEDELSARFVAAAAGLRRPDRHPRHPRRDQRGGGGHHRSGPPAGLHRDGRGSPGRRADDLGLGRLGELQVPGLDGTADGHVPGRPPGRAPQGPAPGGPGPPAHEGARLAEGAHLDRRRPGPGRGRRIGPAGRAAEGPGQRPHPAGRAGRLGVVDRWRLLHHAHHRAHVPPDVSRCSRPAARPRARPTPWRRPSSTWWWRRPGPAGCR